MWLLWHRQEGVDVKVKLSGIVPLLLLVWLRLLLPVLCADMKSVDCSPVLHHHLRASYLLG